MEPDLSGTALRYRFYMLVLKMLLWLLYAQIGEPYPDFYVAARDVLVEEMAVILDQFKAKLEEE